MAKPIYVTQPTLPPLGEFVDSLHKIWDSKVLTNNGSFHQEFEKQLAHYLGVKYISLFSNGTLALITALQTLNIQGEVITTPYSFVATSHALWWNNIKAVFVDIEKNNFTINPEKIEAAITPKTTAILAVHVYGYPCQLKRLQDIANKYGLKLIYDAAHAFGVKINEQSILNYGDLSILSFHATKVFNTIEGGAIICHDKETKSKIDCLKNFGFTGETSVVFPGINAKMNELQAAYGILQLKEVDNNIQKRKNIADHYRKNLSKIEGINFLNDLPNIKHNYSYFPILVDNDKYSRDNLYEKLKKHEIYSRRYFYPLISHFSPYKAYDSSDPSKLPIAEKTAKEVICLPIYPDLTLEQVDYICKII